jgi:transcriptional regulator with XRE-family HTH domain
MSADDILVRLGRAIRARREATGLSQEAFGDRIGVNRAYYGDLERGTRNVSVRNLDRVAKGLATTLAALFAEAELSGPGPASRRTKHKA